MKSFEGVGSTIDEALRAAHRQLPIPPGRDYTVSRVRDFGMQFGGFAGATTFYVVVEQDVDAEFRT